MRRLSMFSTTLILAALLLAACGGQQTSTSVPSTNVPPVTVESTSTNAATEAPTGAATEAPTTDMTTTPGVPVTGGTSPSRLSNLIGTPVCGLGGDQLGTVQDLVFDFDQTTVTYVIVDANGQTVAVPWMSFDMASAASGMGTGTGVGSGTGSQAVGTATTTGGTGTDTGTSTPSGSTTGTGTSTPSSSDTGTSTDQTGQQNCLTLTVDNDTFNNAPAFDQSTLPGKGQSAAGWDSSISSYWANPSSGGTGGTGTTSTDTPSVNGTSSTAMPDTTATATSGSGTGTGTGTGNGLGQGAQQMQGVMLATDILGAAVTVSPQGNDQNSGTGTGSQAVGTATSTGGTSTDTGTATPSGSGTGTGTGTGTNTGDFSQGTVEDMIIEPMTGHMQYLVVRFGSQDTLIPIPIGFLRWDATTNGFVLMVNANALQNAPTFTTDQFPDTTMSGWDQQFSTYWQSNGATGTGTGISGTTISTATATP